MSGGATSGGQSSEYDSLAVIAIVAIVGLGALGSAGLYWARATAWLVAHQVLVAPAAHPVLRLPGGTGADWPRLLMAAAALLVGVVAAGSTLYHRRGGSRLRDQLN